MDGLENLNFQVILDHKDFDREVEKVKEIARGLNKEVAKALKLKQSAASANNKLVLDEEKIKQATAKTAQEQQKIVTEKVKTQLQQQKIKTEIEKTKKAQQGVKGSVQQTNAQLVNTNATLRTSNTLMSTLSRLMGVTFGVAGLRRFLSTLIDITGEFEVQKMALRTMLKDADEADKIFENLRQFAVQSPYTFQELAKYTKQLAAFNIPSRDLLDTNKMLADVAAGLGVSMDRLILAYGHVKSSGFLRGMQLRQFTQNGVPILEELSKLFTEIEGKAVSLGDVFDRMEKRQIPFEMVEEAFKRMTSAGGTFYQMQEVLVQTLKGRIGKLRDVWQQALYDMGQSQDGLLKGSVDKLTKWVANWQETGKALGEIAIAFGSYRLAVVLCEGAMFGFMNTSSKLVNHLATLITYVAANPWILLAAAIAGVTYAIYKNATALTSVEKIQKSVTDSIAKMQHEQDKEINTLDELYAKLRLAKEGTEDYKTAKDAIANKYANYINQLKQEGIEVNNLAAIYDNLREKIEAVIADKQRTAAFRTLEATYDAQQEDVLANLSKGNFRNTSYFKFFQKAFNEGEAMTAMQKMALTQYVTGAVSLDDLKKKSREYEDLLPVVKAIEQSIAHAKEDEEARSTNVEELRLAYKANFDTYIQGVKDLENAMRALKPNPNGPLGPEAPQDWYGGFGRALKTFGTMGHGMYADRVDEMRKQFMYKADENETWEKYYERLGKDYNALSDRLLHAYNDTDREFYEARVRFLQVLDAEYGGALLANNKTVRKEDKAAVQKILTDVNSLEAMRKTYNSLKKMGKSEPQAFAELTKRFSHVDDSLRQHFGFWDALFKKADELEQYDENAADRLRNRIVLEMTTEELKAYTASLKDNEKTKRLSAKGTKALIDAWKREAMTLEKFKNTYLELQRLYMEDGKTTETEARKKAQISMVSLFPGIDFGDFDFDKKIDEYIEKIRNLGARGDEFADSLVASFGRDEFTRLKKEIQATNKAAAEADRALKQYLSSLDKLTKKGGDTENEGASHKVSNAIDKYNDTINDAKKEFDKGEKALADANLTDPVELVKKWLDLINARDRLIATAGNTLKNDVGGLAESFFKEQMQGFDLSNWDDKTYSQIEAIRTALGAVKVPDAIREMLSKTPEGQTALDALDKALQKLVDDMNNNTVDPEWWKKVGKEIRKVAKDFSKVAEAAVEYGEVIGEDWGKALDTMKEMGETLAVIAERWAKEDWIGVASAGLSFLIAKLIEAATEAKRLEIRLADLQEQARHATFMGAISNIGESIFGTNDLEKLRQGMEGVNDALERMNELAGKGFYGKTVVKGQSSGNWFLDFLSLFNNGDHQIAFDTTATRWFSGVASALSTYKLPVFDENGILNRDSLEALKELVPDVASDIQKLINSIDEYYAALEQVEGVMSELVGDIADEASSKLIDQWVEAGNAALDYADILDDVARSYAQMVLKDMILNAIGGEGLVEDLARLMAQGDTEGYMAKIAEAMQIIKDMSPELAAALQGFDPYFNRDDEESSSLGKGIKSITEETASLLASYLNAIRADVSYMRSMAESGWLKIESIAGVVTPKLADYVQQIAANTANNAQSTAEILSRLNDVIGTPDTDGMVVRVQQM